MWRQDIHQNDVLHNNAQTATVHKSSTSIISITFLAKCHLEDLYLTNCHSNTFQIIQLVSNLWLHKNVCVCHYSTKFHQKSCHYKNYILRLYYTNTV
jgi:hypothetical protein